MLHVATSQGLQSVVSRRRTPSPSLSETKQTMCPAYGPEVPRRRIWQPRRWVTRRHARKPTLRRRLFGTGHRLPGNSYRAKSTQGRFCPVGRVGCRSVRRHSSLALGFRGIVRQAAHNLPPSMTYGSANTHRGTSREGHMDRSTCGCGAPILRVGTPTWSTGAPRPPASRSRPRADGWVAVARRRRTNRAERRTPGRRAAARGGQ